MTLVKERLETDLQEAKTELQALDDRLESGFGKSGMGGQLLDLDLARRERLLARIEDLQEALNRVSDGNYGICETCGAQIDPDRLGVLPTTPLCVACAGVRDAEGD
jgi:RNA polymerase-binding transcription factor DksA